MTTKASYTQMQVFCIAWYLLCNHPQQILFFRKQQESCCSDFRRDSSNWITVTTLCSLSDIILPLFVDINVPVFNGSEWTPTLQSKELVNFENSTWINSPPMTVVWVDLWFTIQTSNVSWEAQDHMTHGLLSSVSPLLSRRETVLCLFGSGTFRTCHASSLVHCCSKELRRMRDWDETGKLLGRPCVTSFLELR